MFWKLKKGYWPSLFLAMPPLKSFVVLLKIVPASPTEWVHKINAKDFRSWIFVVADTGIRNMIET